MDVMEASLNCQPSSDAADKHDPHDPRHLINDVIIAFAAAIGPKVLVVEDVVGFRHNQPAVFASFLGKLKQQFATVEMVVCNARDAMVAQNRNRLFFVCTNSVSLAPMQRAVVRQRTCSAPTHPTMREMLRPYVPAKQLAPRCVEFSSRS